MSTKKQMILYPGSFNPFTIGHLNICEKSEYIFGAENVFIAVGVNPEKNISSGIDRAETIRKNLPSKNVVTFSGLLTDFIYEKEQEGYDVTVVKGLRNGDDLAFEVNQLRFMEEMKPDIKVVFIYCDKQFAHVSSSAYRLLEAVKPGSGHRYLAKEVESNSHMTKELVEEFICQVHVNEDGKNTIEKYVIIPESQSISTNYGFEGTYVECLNWIKGQELKEIFVVFLDYQSIDNYAMMRDSIQTEDYLSRRLKFFRGDAEECKKWKEENPYVEFRKSDYEIGASVAYDKEQWIIYDIKETECTLSYVHYSRKPDSVSTKPVITVQRVDAPWIWKNYKRR